MTAPESCDLLIHDAEVLTVDGADRVIPGGAVAIGGGRILAVGTTRSLAARFAPAARLDAGGGVLHPGFVDAHIHVSQYTARSVLPAMAGTAIGMGDWKAALTPEDEHASATLAAVDYLRAGYTGFVDPGTVFAPDAVAAVAAETGIRLWLTDPYVADLGQRLADNVPELASPGFLARWPRDLDEAVARIGGQLFRNRADDGRVHAFIGLYGEETGSDALRRAAHDRARAEGVQVQEHLGYLPRSYRAAEARLGRRMIAQLADAGLLGPHVTYTHMNVVHADDVPALAGSGTRIVWCPYGQLQMIGHGDAEPRMAALHRAGVPVGIASDIPRAVSFAGLGSLAVGAAAAAGDPVTGREVLRMRTIGAAATVGADSFVGSIEPGKRADLVLRRPAASEALGLDRFLETAAIAGTDSVDAVLVDGEVLVRNGHLVRADPARIAETARASARRIAARIGLR